MILDTITNDIIQRTLDEGGKVYAFNQTEKFEVVRAYNGNITINSGTYEFQVGEKISFIYEPKFSYAWCNEYSDLDGDGIIDLVDLDKDGDGVIDPRAPLRPSRIIAEIVYAPLAVSDILISQSPNKIALVNSRVYGKPIAIDGYYPLYTTQIESDIASPVNSSHPHVMSEEYDGQLHQWEYWMPHGVNQWHGNYAMCPPDDVTEVIADSVETYDWEYVDRAMSQRRFSSIIPRDYRLRILGVDRDENGTFEDQDLYQLVDISNINDIRDESGNVTTRANTKHAHFVTNPQQVWTYEVVSKDTSENILEDGHSFQMGNFGFYLSTYTKFDVGTEDANQHTLSKLEYFSRFGNGNNADMNANQAAVIITQNAEGEWVRENILEINSDGFVILDKDIFDVGDRFYIYLEDFPSNPSNVSAEALRGPLAVQFVDAELVPVEPRNLALVRAELMPPPSNPSDVFAVIVASDQEIVWEQFE
jgi:hypothetical protein